MATIDEFVLKNIGLWWRYGIGRHYDEWKYIIIGRIFESEIILIPPSLKILHQRPIFFKANSSIVAILELIRGAQCLIEVIRCSGEEMWRVDVQLVYLLCITDVRIWCGPYDDDHDDEDIVRSVWPLTILFNFCALSGEQCWIFWQGQTLYLISVCSEFNLFLTHIKYRITAEVLRERSELTRGLPIEPRLWHNILLSYY
jgi:hypothetical protein